MWKTYTIPRNEGTRIHHAGSTQLCVAVDQAGEGTVLSSLVRYNQPSARANRQITDLPPLSDKTWIRSFIGKAEQYELKPAFPPVPICVRLREAFSLGSGQELDGWIFSTLEAHLSVQGKSLAAYPLRKPFKTLFGMPETGVICRYDEADFLASGEAVLGTLHDDPVLVAHPVHLKNVSSMPVTVTDLCIYGEQLSIFRQGSRFQTEGIQFTFSQAGVRMNLDSKASLGPGSVLVAKPSVSDEERFIERSFELFKAITRI